MTPDDSTVDAFRRDGAVLLPGLMREWVETIAAGIERNLDEPGPERREYVEDGHGRFFGDYCNWQRIAEFREVVFDSPLAAVASRLMGSSRVQFFHDHVLVKESGTDKATPWHQDAPYYFVDGEQSVSFWIPVDAAADSTLRLIAGSHRWPKLVTPVRWLNEAGFYADEGEYQAAPDPDAEPDRYQVLEWPIEPGDVVAFHFRTVHGARGNPHATRRRVLSMRFVGDDARYVERPGATSPPFTGHGMQPGDTLREDWFPVLDLADREKAAIRVSDRRNP